MKKLLFWGWLAGCLFLLADITALKLHQRLFPPPPAPAAPPSASAPVPVGDPAAALPGPPPTSLASEPPHFMLRGTVLGTRADLALLSLDGNFRALAVGETVEGWKLVKVEREQAFFERGAERYTARLDQPPPTAVAPQPVLNPNETDLAGLLHGIQLQPEATGMRVTQVDKSAPLARCGLEAGDLIQDVNGHPIRTLENVRELIPVLQGEEEISLSLVRGSQTVGLHIPLR